MRVLGVTGTLGVGGAERYLSRIAPMLRDTHGILMELCVLWPGGALERDLRARGITVFSTSPEARRPGVLERALRAMTGIHRLVRQRRYDAVHSYLFPAEVFATVAGRLARCPRVIVSRRALLPVRRPEGPAYAAVDLVTNALAHELIANSYAVLRDSERAPVLPRRRTVIYGGIDVEGRPLAHPSSEGPLRLVTVGSLVEHKGHRELITAVRSAREAGVDARLTLVGAGPDEPLLRRLAGGAQTAEHVIFAGLQLDPRPFLADADIFVLPSHTEGFSNALLEAMASALPVVATDVGGNAEVVEHGISGLVVPARDPAALARALIELAGKRDRLASMGQAGRERVEREFTLAASAERLARWYLGEARPG
jgi:glycosyltransferase involved in cell wall biosynthesis